MKTYFEKLPMFTYEVFTQVGNADDFAALLCAVDSGVEDVFLMDIESDPVDDRAASMLEAFKAEFGFEAGYLIDTAKACKAFDFPDALRVLYAEAWAGVRKLPEFAMLPANIRHEVAKFDTMDMACRNYKIIDKEEFELSFLDWAARARADMDCVDYPDFIACAHLALMTQC